MQLDKKFNCCLAIERQFYMAMNFEDVDQIESAANFCKCPLALYPEMHSTIWRFTDMTMARDEDIDLECWENVPVGHFLKLYLDFEGNGNFGKIRAGPVMLKYIAATEIKNPKIIRL